MKKKTKRKVIIVCVDLGFLAFFVYATMKSLYQHEWVGLVLSAGFTVYWTWSTWRNWPFSNKQKNDPRKPLDDSSHVG